MHERRAPGFALRDDVRAAHRLSAFIEKRAADPASRHARRIGAQDELGPVGRDVLEAQDREGRATAREERDANRSFGRLAEHETALAVGAQLDAK